MRLKTITPNFIISTISTVYLFVRVLLFILVVHVKVVRSTVKMAITMVLVEL